MTDYVTGRAGAREDFCRYLAACYYEPSKDFAEERLFDSMVAASSAIDPGLAEAARRLGEAFAGTGLQELLVDYTRLFVGPSQPLAMPYASFWLVADPSQRHEATMAVLDLYAEGGFEVSEDIHELPDHVAVELEFLYALICAGNQAQRVDAPDELATASSLHRRFGVEHMGGWIGRFASAVNSGAQTAFYSELANITLSFLRMESAVGTTN